MFKIKYFILLILFAFTTNILAGGGERTELINKLKTHINNVVKDVKAEENPLEKRAILSESITDLIDGLNKVESLTGIPENDRTSIDKFKSNLTEKYNELNGLNGYEKVKDGQLNNFAQYFQQDVEQADTILTISLTTLLLIIIIVLLIA